MPDASNVTFVALNPPGFDVRFESREPFEGQTVPVVRNVAVDPEEADAPADLRDRIIAAALAKISV